MARLSHFSNQRSALEYFAGCLFHEQILFFRFQKKAWHKTVSSSLQHLWVVQQLSHKFYSFNTFLFLHHAFSFSPQLLSVSYLSCHCLFTCHQSSFPWHCICMHSALSQTYSIRPLRELSFPVPSWQSAHFLFHWVMLFFCMVIFWCTLPYCILTVLSEYKWIFLVALFLFLLYFQVVHSFPHLGTWFSDLHHIPIVQHSF